MLLNGISFGSTVLNIQPKKSAPAFQGAKPPLSKDTVQFSSKKDLSPEEKLADDKKYAKAIQDYFYKTDRLDCPSTEEIINANQSPEDKKYAEAVKKHKMYD